MKLRTFRHAAQLPLADPAATNLKILAVDQGPGWVEMWSPDAVVRWRVSGAESNVTQNKYFETGPASLTRIWLGRLGSSVYVDSIVAVLNAARAVRQSDGTILGGLAAEDRAFAAARFYPSDVYRETACLPSGIWYSPEHPFTSPHSTTIVGQIPNLATTDIGFPPGERRSLTVLSDAALTVTVSSVLGGKTVLYTSTAAIRHTLNVSPWHFVSLDNASGGAVDYQILWRDVGSITNA